MLRPTDDIQTIIWYDNDCALGSQEMSRILNVGSRLKASSEKPDQNRIGTWACCCILLKT